MLCLCAKNIKASEPKMFFLKKKLIFVKDLEHYLGQIKLI
jgi:hypothetical protein